MRPVDAGNLQTARAKYFGMQLQDWRRRIAVAARKGYAGDILTLARDAPNRMSERRIVLDAAKRLVSLRRYQPAAELLRQLLGDDPDNVTVLSELGQVEGRLGDLPTAEAYLRRAAELRQGDPEAYGMLGRVSKDRWRLRWEQQPDLAQRQRSAVQNSQLAADAASSYDAAVRHDLRSYYNGINALGLTRLLTHLRRATGRAAVRAGVMQWAELASVVRVAARSAAERAQRADPSASDKDREEWIWATATLGELKLLEERRRLGALPSSDGQRRPSRSSSSTRCRPSFVCTTVWVCTPTPRAPCSKSSRKTSGTSRRPPGRSIRWCYRAAT